MLRPDSYISPHSLIFKSLWVKGSTRWNTGYNIRRSCAHDDDDSDDYDDDNYGDDDNDRDAMFWHMIV